MQQYIPTQIIQEYNDKKNDYIRRIRNLSDHVEISYPDNGNYIGQVANGKRDGQGIFFYPSSDVYFGAWCQDSFHGQGVYIFSSGEIYDGLLEMNEKQGIGTYYYDNARAFYSGNWYQDLKHGSGLLTSSD